MSSRFTPWFLSACLAVLPGASAGGEPTPTPDRKGKEVRTDLHGDPLPDGALARMGTLRFRVGGKWPKELAFSPDGKILAVAAGEEEKLPALWDATTGRRLRRLKRKEGFAPVFISSVAFTPDGKTLVAGSAFDPDVWFFDVTTGKEVRRLNVQKRPVTIALSPDGKLLACAGSDHAIRLWDAANGRRLRRCEGHKDRVGSVAFAPGGKSLASAAGDGTLRLWNVESGKEVYRLPVPKRVGARPRVAFSPDGTLLAAAGSDSAVRLWAVRTGKELRRLQTGEGPHDEALSVAFSPDGKVLVAGGLRGRGELTFWDPATGKRLRRLGVGGGGVGVLTISPDGKTLATSGPSAVVRLWDPATGKEKFPFGGNFGPVEYLAVCPDGKTLATWAGDHAFGRAHDPQPIRLWEAFTGREVRQLAGHSARINALACSPAPAPLLASAGPVGDNEGHHAILLWDWKTGKRLRSFGEQKRDWIGSLAFSPDGKTLVSGGADDAVHVWEVPAGKELRHWKARSGRSVAVVLLGSKGMATLGEDNSVRVWDPAGGKELRKLQRAGECGVNLVASPDGRTLAWCERDNALQFHVALWDVEAGDGVRNLSDEGIVPQELAFSPDGKSLAVGAGKYVELWEPATGEPRGILGAHEGAVRALAFAPDGNALASGSEDTTALVWDVYGRLSRPAPKLSGTELVSLWTDLASHDATKGFAAVCALARSAGQAAPFLRAHQPPVPAADARKVTRLIADLDSNEFAARERAHKELEKLGEGAVAALRRALAARPALEVRRRLKRLLEPYDRPDSPGNLRAARATEALEHAGTDPARALLREWARGAAEARLTREAKASLARLSRRAATRP